MSNDTMSKREFLETLESLIPNDARLAIYSQMSGEEVPLDDDSMHDLIQLADVVVDEDDREIEATHYVMG